MRIRLSNTIITAAVAATLLATTAQAQSWRAYNLLTVVPLNNADFEVIEARGEGARGIWCAAADYALRVKGHDRGARLYVKEARGPSRSGLGRKGVVFTLDPARLSQPPSQALSVSVRQVGQGLPVHHAHQFCKDYQIEPEDVLWPRRGG